jgi:23S rRNA pseudouridine1911/1915/1917 synthase
MTPNFGILFESDDLLVINKPAGLVCHPTKGDANSSLIGRVRLYLGASHPSAHLVNRLDRETSGVTLVAKNPATAGALGKSFEARDVEKCYWAIVHGFVSPNSGIIEAPLGKDESSRVAIKDCVRQDGAPSVTGFEVLERFERNKAPFTLLKVQPLTGRKHQIRIHLAHAGHPIVGDKLYGGDESLYLAFVRDALTDVDLNKLELPFQALHARQLGFQLGEVTHTFVAEPELWFSDFCKNLRHSNSEKLN